MVLGALLEVAASRRHFVALSLAAVGGWTAILAPGQWLRLPTVCGAADKVWTSGGSEGILTALAFNPPVNLLFPWLAMVVAMMPLLLVQPVAHLSNRSFARRRPRAIALFFCGYGAAWSAAGLALITATVVISAATSWLSLPVVVPVIGIAVIWQATPVKQICLNRCHGLPRLSAFGLAADWDCTQYGLTAGIWCVGSCWALMLIPLVAGSWHLITMALITVLLLPERFAPARPPQWAVPIRLRRGLTLKLRPR